MIVIACCDPSKLSGVFQYAGEFRFRVAHNVRQYVSPISKKGYEVSVVPTALFHLRRQSAQEPKLLQPARRRNDRCREPMIAVQDSQ